MVRMARRGIITGLISLAAAPAIVRVSSLMRCSPTEDLCTLREVNANVNIVINWDPATPEEILDDVRRMLVESTGIPARLLFGEGLPPMTPDELRIWRRVALS